MVDVDAKYVVKTIMMGILVIAAIAIIYIYYKTHYDQDEIIPIRAGRPKPIKIKKGPYSGQYTYDTMPAEIDEHQQLLDWGNCEKESKAISYDNTQGPPPESLVVPLGNCAKSIYMNYYSAQIFVAREPTSENGIKAKKIVDALERHWGVNKKTLCKYIRALKSKDAEGNAKNQEYLKLIQCD